MSSIILSQLLSLHFNNNFITFSLGTQMFNILLSSGLLEQIKSKLNSSSLLITVVSSPYCPYTFLLNRNHFFARWVFISSCILIFPVKFYASPIIHRKFRFNSYSIIFFKNTHHIFMTIFLDCPSSGGRHVTISCSVLTCLQSPQPLFHLYSFQFEQSLSKFSRQSQSYVSHSPL